MPTLHGFPLGLLDMVGAMNRGETPRELAYVIQPTVELRDLYLASKQTFLGRASATIAAGPNTAWAAPLQVPVGEVWVVSYMSLFVSCGAGDAGTFWCSYFQDGNQFAISDKIVVPNNGTDFAISRVGPMIAPAGSRFGVFGAAVTAGPQGGAALLVTRLRA